MDFKIGQKYKGIGPDNHRPVLIKVTRISDTELSFNVLEGDTDDHFDCTYDSDFAKCLELVTDKPHICEILGVEVGEVFGFEAGKFLVDEKGLINVVGNGWTSSNRFCDMVNHPEKIIRQPQFSDDQIAFMRELAKAGLPIFYRCASDCLRVRKLDSSSWIDLPNSMLPSITEEFGDINAAKYLEGLK